MSGAAPEWSQFYVRERLKANQPPPLEGSDLEGHALESGEYIERIEPQREREPPLPVVSPNDPIVEPLQTLPDSDLVKLAKSFKVKASGDRNALINALASLGLGPANLED